MEGLIIVDEATVAEPLGGTGTGAPTKTQEFWANESVPVREIEMLATNQYIYAITDSSNVFDQDHCTLFQYRHS